MNQVHAFGLTAVVPAEGQETFHGGDLSAGASKRWISQCPLALFLMASTPSCRTIPKHVSFEQSFHLNCLETSFPSHTQCNNYRFSDNSQTFRRFYMK